MMDKIIRSMFRGSFKTKVYLWSILVLGLVAFGLLVAAAALAIPQMAAGAAGLGLVCFVTTQSVSVNRLEKDAKQKKKQKELADVPSEEMSPKERERAKARFLSSLNEKQVKKMLHHYHVTPSHKKIMIDTFVARKLVQVPAYAWRTNETLHFLVLEGHANEFEIPLSDIKGIYLDKKVTADAENDYAFFRFSNYIAKLFAPYLPEYTQATSEGNLIYQKDLYYIEPGIYVTNTSVSNLMELLPRVPFLLDDEVCRSDRFDEYFKEIYRASVLCKTGVISLEEYKEQILRTLDSLLKAPVTTKEFVDSMRYMARYHLITNEQAMEYTQKYRAIHQQGAKQ